MCAFPGPGAKSCAVCCYLVALTGQAALVLLVLLLGLDWLPPRTWLPVPWAWAADVGALVLFGVQHSGMARTGFKRTWTRLVPAHLERSVYAGLSGLILLGLALTWQTLPGEPLWRLPPWTVVVALAGAAGVGLVCLRFDHAGLFGLRQAWHPEGDAEPEQLLTCGPYRYVRHPLMACTLVFLWGQPVLSPGLLLLSGGLTVYILVGLWLEERDLLRQFGPAYASYRRRVPALVPWRLPARFPVDRYFSGPS